MNNTTLDAQVHHVYIDRVRREGFAPNRFEVAQAIAQPVEDIEASLRRLDRSHSLTLHPNVCEPWLVQPFALSPSSTWVQTDDRGWWAPCVWCGLGVAALVGRDVSIHTRIGGESENIDIHVVDGQVVEKDLWVHFSIRPQVAWDNVHHHCACLLPFLNPLDARGWSERHRLPLGEVVPIETVQYLAREWYGRHCEPNWRKVNIAEAAVIFRKVGLVAPFWALEEKEGTY